jgi:hypothetical protein
MFLGCSAKSFFTVLLGNPGISEKLFEGRRIRVSDEE